MVALSSIGGVPSVQRRKVWLMLTAGVPCSNAVKTRNPLKFVGVPQTPEPISAASGPKLRRYSPTKLCDGAQMAIFGVTFLRPVYSASRVQHVSDLRLKFALRPHRVWKYGRQPIYDG